MKRMGIIFVLVLAWPLTGFTGQDNGAACSARRPVAKSQQELDDYRSAASGGTGSALDRAADDFAHKYPQSQLRCQLYLKSLRQYQRENDSAGILAAGESVLALDPDNTLALVLTSTVLADGLTRGDPDGPGKITAIHDRADRALRVLTAESAARAASTPDRDALYRSTLQATAYFALGLMELKTGDDAAAEKDLRAGADLAELRPDPYIWYHLALAQDHRKKYRAALNSVEQAMQLSSGNPQLQRLAEAEHERLSGKVGNRGANQVEEDQSPDHQGPGEKDAPATTGGTRPPK